MKLRRPIHKQLSDARRGSRLDCLPRCFNCFSISLVHSTVECTRLISKQLKDMIMSSVY